MLCLSSSCSGRSDEYTDKGMRMRSLETLTWIRSLSLQEEFGLHSKTALKSCITEFMP